MSRAFSVALAVAGTCWLMAACGGGSHGAAGSSAATAYPPATSRSAVTPPTRLDVQRVRALAPQINLTLADVPGFKVSGTRGDNRETGTEQRLQRDMLSCAGAQRFPRHGLLEAGSSTFEREGGLRLETVQSNVTLAASAALAGEELGAIRSKRGGRCIAHYMGLLLSGHSLGGAKVGSMHVFQGTPPAPGTDGSFAMRLSATLTLGRVQLPLYIDLLGFAYGPVEVLLQAVGLPTAFPAGLEEHLYSLLIERTKAHIA